MSPPAEKTVAELQATGAVRVRPGILEITLRSQHHAPTSAAAQREVNADVTAAAAEAKALKQLVIKTGNYGSWYVGKPGEGYWQVHQSITLTGPGDKPMMLLAGKLQSGGFVVSDMQWRVSAAQKSAARSKATALAIGELRREAATAARGLGDHFRHFREIDVTSSETAPGPRPVLMAAAGPVGAPSFPVPVSIPSPTTIRVRALGWAVMTGSR